MLEGNMKNQKNKLCPIFLTPISSIVYTIFDSAMWISLEKET